MSKAERPQTQATPRVCGLSEYAFGKRIPYLLLLCSRRSLGPGCAGRSPRHPALFVWVGKMVCFRVVLMSQRRRASSPLSAATDSSLSLSPRPPTLLGLAFKELAFAETELGAELLDLLLGVGAAGDGVRMHRPPVADLLAQFEELGSAGQSGETGHKKSRRRVEAYSRGRSFRVHSSVVTDAAGASQVSSCVYRMRTRTAMSRCLEGRYRSRFAWRAPQTLTLTPVPERAVAAG